jgi:hypothetical protein
MVVDDFTKLPNNRLRRGVRMMWDNYYNGMQNPAQNRRRRGCQNDVENLLQWYAKPGAKPAQPGVSE